MSDKRQNRTGFVTVASVNISAVKSLNQSEYRCRRCCSEHTQAKEKKKLLLPARILPRRG